MCRRSVRYQGHGRRRSRLGPALVALGLALALSPLLFAEGDSPVSDVVSAVLDAATDRVLEVVRDDGA